MLPGLPDAYVSCCQPASPLVDPGTRSSRVWRPAPLVYVNLTAHMAARSARR